MDSGARNKRRIVRRPPHLVVPLPAMESGDPNDPGAPLVEAALTPADAPVPAIEPVTASAQSFPLSRSTTTLGHVVSKASDAWRRDLGTWVLATILSLLIGFGIPAALGLVVGMLRMLLLAGGSGNPAGTALFQGLDIGVQGIQTVVQGVLGMGFSAMAIHGLHGRPAPIGALFSQIHKAFKYLAQLIAIWLPIGLVFGGIGAALFYTTVGSFDRNMPLEDALRDAAPVMSIYAAIAGPILMYVVLGLVFTPVELTYNDAAGPIEAIKNSWQIANGKRWLILGTIIIAGLIAATSSLLCGIGFLFGAPLATLIVTALYLGLRDGANVPQADSDSTLGRRY